MWSSGIQITWGGGGFHRVSASELSKCPLFYSQMSFALGSANGKEKMSTEHCYFGVELCCRPLGTLPVGHHVLSRETVVVMETYLTSVWTVSLCCSGLLYPTCADVMATKLTRSSHNTQILNCFFQCCSFSLQTLLYQCLNAEEQNKACSHVLKKISICACADSSELSFDARQAVFECQCSLGSGALSLL